MSLLKFELYKIFRQKSVWITLVLLLGWVFLFTGSYPYDAKVEESLYNEWEGPVTEEKVEQAKIEYQALVGQKELSDTEQLKLKLYEEVIQAGAVKARITERLAELAGDDSRKAELEASMLEDITIDEFTYHTGPSTVVTLLQFGSFIILAVMVLLGISPIYTREYNSGVDQYLFSSKKGRRPLAWAKIGAAIIYTMFIVLVWEAYNLIINRILHEPGGWSTPIQLLSPLYQASPYPLDALEYHLIQLGIHTLTAIAFTLLVIVISSLSKNLLLTFFISLAILVSPAFLGSVEWLEPVLRYAFGELLQVEDLFAQFSTVNVLGIPVLYPVFACIVMGLLAVVAIGLVHVIVRKKEVTT